MGRFIKFCAALLVTLIMWLETADFAFAAKPRRRDLKYADCTADVTWRSNNNQWYIDLGVEKFKEQAAAKGLDNHADYKRKEIASLLGIDGGPIPPAILVIGAGFGRDLEYLTQKSNVSHIYAVEVGLAQIAHLRQHYDFDSDGAINRARTGMVRQKVTIYGDNITDPTEFPEKVQVAFWMFAGILELSPGEKWQTIQNLSLLLDEGGTVVVDVPAGKIVSNFEIREGEDTIRLKNPRASGHAELSLHPINHFTNEVDVKKIQHAFERERKFTLYRTVDYRTDTDQKRQLLMFIKN